ncbi:hypothetical protein EXE59_19795 [Nocardioides eburneiflavus]|uniref:Uncharacterized protein n=1 Tax=Nocardioides eburneiflavus TaxID=2518372 RepID=A0A4Z1C8B2_9ACTN|nr:hypothetical protein [Nocardioides eburneiflavus]TGN65942.1 hypothetical protein EXE59_19795 [Nocardioides eburneiflavus]
MSSSRKRQDRTAGGAARSVSRVVTLVLAVGFAVVGVAGAASAHHNTITGTVTCKSGGGWSVAWSVENSEQITETITASNRAAVVPVGTQLTARQTRTFTETVTAKPTSPLRLELSARWSNGTTATNSGSIAVSSFADGCNVTTVDAPSIPVVDECGPGNAHYGQVPSGPWTSTTNPDGSVTVTTTPGHQFPDGQTTLTYPAPADSNQPCPTPPVVTPPVTTPPEVLPAQVRVVSANARKIDKCGRASDLFKVVRSRGVVYRANGKVVRQGAWIKAEKRSVTVRARAVDETFRLRGKQVWRMTFTDKPCARAPQVAPDTGAR